jgi:outer membrane receptor protein involved in Fe transport
VIFDRSIKGFQSNAHTGIGYSLVNAGEESVKGCEIDSAWRPIDWLSLTAAETYLGNATRRVIQQGPGRRRLMGRRSREERPWRVGPPWPAPSTSG